MYTKCIYLLSIDIFPPREQVKLAAHLWLFAVIFKIVSNYLLSQLSFKYLCSSNWYYIKVTLSKHTNKERFLAASMCNINWISIDCDNLCKNYSYPLIASISISKYNLWIRTTCVRDVVAIEGHHMAKHIWRVLNLSSYLYTKKQSFKSFQFWITTGISW